jgi:uncharacterized protein YndB with AHSA1/START domain
MATATSGTDRIGKTIVVKAPRPRVWRALTEAGEFGQWFGVDLSGTFAPGQRLRGRITHPKYAHVTMEITVERVEPERLVSWRWHPYAVDPGVDYAAEPTTLVEFTLDDVPEGTRLTVVESGFDRIPAGRRAEAYRMNEGGWTSQVQNIARHVAPAR